MLGMTLSGGSYIAIFIISLISLRLLLKFFIFPKVIKKKINNKQSYIFAILLAGIFIISLHTYIQIAQPRPLHDQWGKDCYR